MRRIRGKSGLTVERKSGHIVWLKTGLRARLWVRRLACSAAVPGARGPIERRPPASAIQEFRELGCGPDHSLNADKARIAASTIRKGSVGARAAR